MLPWSTGETLEGLPHLTGLENGPGFDSQGSVNFFTKYCFPNLHWIHVKAFEVEDCEFVPLHHQPKVKSKVDIFTIDLRVILSIILATGVYALLLKFLQKNSPHNVQTKGGWVNGFLNNVRKTALSLHGGFP